MYCMSKVPGFLMRYYVEGENPYLSLNDYPFEQANSIKNAHCKSHDIGGFYAEDSYLIERRKVEKWIYEQLISKGGKPECDIPIYMTLGESPAGEYDIRADLQKNAAELKIPLEGLDLLAITFTFPDSMYKIILNDDGDIIDSGRTNTPQVYLYYEIGSVIEKYEKYLADHYIEAQVWNRSMLPTI